MGFSNGRRMRGWLAAAAGLLLSAPLAAQDALPKGEEIVDKYVAATGTAEAYAKVKSRVMKGRMELGGQALAGPMTVYQTRPARQLLVIELEGMGKIEQGSDGDIFWERSAMTGPRLLEGQERAIQERAVAIDSAVNWRKHYKGAETVGVEDLDGKPAYKVVQTPNQGNPETSWYDKESGLLVKQQADFESQMGVLKITSTFHDYKKFGDFLVATKVMQNLGDLQQTTILVESLEDNVDIPAEKFALPDDVKELIDASRRSSGTSAPAAPASAPAKP